MHHCDPVGGLRTRAIRGVLPNRIIISMVPVQGSHLSLVGDAPF